MVNAYIVNDPTDPENNDTVKILRFGKQLHKIIMEGITGEDQDQFGERIFDLSENGCTFRVRCDKQGDFPTYVSSKFLIPGPIEGLSESRMKEVYNSCFTLEETFRSKSFDELKQMLDEHYHCIDPGSSESIAEASPPVSDFGKKDSEPSNDPDLDEEVPMDFDSKKAAEESEDDPLEDDKVKELLAGLDDV